MGLRIFFLSLEIKKEGLIRFSFWKHINLGIFTHYFSKEYFLEKKNYQENVPKIYLIFFYKRICYHNLF